MGFVMLALGYDGCSDNTSRGGSSASGLWLTVENQSAESETADKGGTTVCTKHGGGWKQRLKGVR